MMATAAPAWANGTISTSGSVGYNPSSVGSLVNVLLGSPGGGGGGGGSPSAGSHGSGGGPSGGSRGGGSGGGPTGPPPYLYLPTGLVPGPNGQGQGLYAVVNPNNTAGANTAACGGTAFCFVPMGGATASAPGATGPPPPSPGQLALEAANKLNLTAPAIHTGPDTLDGHSPDAPVNFLTWMWLDQGGYGPQSVTASAGGVSATTTATPIGQVTFDMGDGGSVTCQAPGTVRSLAIDPTASAPSPSGCSYTYHHSTDGRGPYTITATIGFAVHWTSNVGQSGTLPGLTASSSTGLNVDQIESVITGSG